jgi:hypothetical protein
MNGRDVAYWHIAKFRCSANVGLSVNLRHGSRDRVSMSWNQQFFHPVVLPQGRKLITLRDAAQYITKRPKTEHDAPE